MTATQISFKPGLFNLRTVIYVETPNIMISM